WDLVPELDYRSWRFGRAQRQDFIGRLAAGPFVGFSLWYFFLFTYWTAALALVVAGARLVRDSAVLTCVIVVTGFTAILVVVYGFTSTGELYVMNYRYAMTVLPFVVVIAGVFFASSIGSARPIVGLLCGTAFVVVLTAQTVTLAATALVPAVSQISVRSIAADRMAELGSVDRAHSSPQLAELWAMQDANRLLPRDSFVLSFHQNVFAYYVDRHSIADADLRLVPFYKAADKREAVRILRQLGITHFFVPPWTDWPTIQNSQIRTIIQDSSLTETLSDQLGYRLIALRPEAED